MMKTLKLEEKIALRQKGWMIFSVVMAMQVVFVGIGYLLQSS